MSAPATRPWKVVYHNAQSPNLPYIVPADHDCDHPYFESCSLSDEIAVSFTSRGAANAERIVRCVNAHEALVAVHKAVHALWEAETIEPWTKDDEARRQSAVTDAWGPLILAIEAADEALS